MKLGWVSSSCAKSIRHAVTQNSRAWLRGRDRHSLAPGARLLPREMRLLFVACYASHRARCMGDDASYRTARRSAY
jgi:hypothetical protein